MRNLAYFLGSFALVFLLGIGSAYAETIPSTPATTFTDLATLHVTGSHGGGPYTSIAGCLATVSPTYSYRHETGPHNSHFQVSQTNTGGGSCWVVASNSSCPSGLNNPSIVNTLSGSDVHGHPYLHYKCQSVEPSCPSSYTLSADRSSCSRPDCPYGRDSEGNCIGQCDEKGNQEAVSGYYTSPPSLICKAGCVAKRSLLLDGSPGYNVLINGKTQLYAKYSYDYVPNAGNATNGVACSDVSQSLADSTPPEPVTSPQNITQSCAQGQQGGTVNGVYKCFDQTTGQPVAESGPVEKEKTTTQTQTNPDGSQTETTTTTYPDGSQKVVVKTTQPSGQSSTETTEIGSDGKPIVTGGLGSSGSPNGSQDALKQGVKEGAKEGIKEGLTDYCTDNPTAAMCNNEEITPGTAASISGLYDKQSGDKTFQSVLTGFKTSIQSQPFYSAATSVLSISVPAGACTGFSASVPVSIMGVSKTFTIDMTEAFCGSTASLVYTLLGIGIMIAAVWVAIRIAFL